ncbi:MAG: hypothetical protein MR355_01895 [Lachnospiraceae bacterium]|nr:hypothetical protein [Lachnospiraceae bacterium]
MAIEYKDKESFEDFFKQTYIPLDYASIRNEMREAAAAGWELFTEEYQMMHRMSKSNYILYMTSDAYCSFEEIVENAVDELNSGITDVVMEIGNEIEFDNNITEIYFDTIEQTLKEMLDALYDDVLGKLV